jgi:hypothetical protein
MNRIASFFLVTSRDLKMQILSVSEIAAYMQKTDERTLKLPHEFASTMRKILRNDNQVGTSKIIR